MVELYFFGNLAVFHNLTWAIAGFAIIFTLVHAGLVLLKRSPGDQDASRMLAIVFTALLAISLLLGPMAMAITGVIFVAVAFMMATGLSLAA